MLNNLSIDLFLHLFQNLASYCIVQLAPGNSIGWLFQLTTEVHTLAALQLLSQFRQETPDEFALEGFPGFVGEDGFLQGRI